MYKRQGSWGGRIKELDLPGEYQLIAGVKEGNESLGQARVNFQIIDNQPERNNPRADFQQLNRLAEMTVDQGGKVVVPDELNITLQGIIDGASQQEVEVQLSWQWGSTSHSAWFLTILISLLLAGDWMLRKKWGLV